MTLNKKKKKAISIHIMYDNTSGSDIHVTSNNSPCLHVLTTETIICISCATLLTCRKHYTYDVVQSKINAATNILSTRHENNLINYE